MTFKSDFNMMRFPFDEQTLRGSIAAAANFESNNKAAKTRLEIGRVDPSKYQVVDETKIALLDDARRGIYTKTDWITKEASMFPSTANSVGTNCRKEGSRHLCLDFEIKMQRAAVGGIFKVLVRVTPLLPCSCSLRL